MPKKDAGRKKARGWLKMLQKLVNLFFSHAPSSDFGIGVTLFRPAAIRLRRQLAVVMCYGGGREGETLQTTLPHACLKDFRRKKAEERKRGLMAHSGESPPPTAAAKATNRFLSMEERTAAALRRRRLTCSGRRRRRRRGQ